MSGVAAEVPRPLVVVTDADRCRWQAQSIAALVELARLGRRHLLPPLSWQVGRLGGIVGHVLDGDRRAVFDRWLAVLRAAYGDVDRWPDRADAGAITHLHANVEVDQWVTVALVTDIHPDTAEDAGERAA